MQRSATREVTTTGYVFFAVVICLTALGTVGISSVRAEEKNLQPAKDDKPIDPFLIPDGTPEKIFEYIEKLRSLEPEEGTREEVLAHFTKVYKTVIKACDKILSGKIDNKTALRIYQMKFQSFRFLNMLGDPNAEKSFNTLASKLIKDKRPGFADEARLQKFAYRADQLQRLTEKESRKLINDFTGYLKKTDVNVRQYGLAMSIGEALESFGLQELAAHLYEQLAKAVAGSKNQQLATQAESLEGTARRLRLPGNSLKLTGYTVEGDRFDWSAYEGKVVLVDFWATWCGPCRAELPNVLRNYKLYHDRGFEVVGINLDDDLEELIEFLEEREIPWTNLFGKAPEDRGWQHPMARYYGVSGIPTVILVDQKGKVVSMQARGRELGRLLGQLLGPPSKKNLEKVNSVAGEE